MKEGFGFFIIVIAAIVAALTNPSKNEHLQALSDHNTVVGGIVELGSMFGGVNYNNYVVASTLSIDGKEITLGLFRNVVVLNEENSK